MQNENNQQPQIINPFDWRIWLLGIYIFLLLMAAGFFLIGLILADTTQTADTLAACKVAAANTAPNSNGAANTSGNSAVNTNSAVNQNVNSAVNTNTANTNVNAANTNAVRNAAANAAANNGANPVNTPANTQANTQTPPSPSPSPQTYTIPKIVRVDSFDYLYLSGCMTGDGYLFLLVLFAGMVGAGIRGVFSFFVHLGRKDFGFNWVWFYILLPFFGSSLSLVLYLVIRGGFYGGAVGQAVSLNAYSFAALGALTGLFSDQAMEKLKMVAESLLTKTPSKTIEATINKVDIAPNLTLTKSSPTEKLTVTAKDEAGKSIPDVKDTDFIWISDNPSVATVDGEGKVKLVAEGKCNVKATSKKSSVVSNNCEVICIAKGGNINEG